MQDDAKRLEPCPNPWCNSHKTTDAEIRAMETPILMPSRASSEWAVACPVCPVQTPFFDTEAEAIAAWNRRTTAPAQPADVERVARAIYEQSCRNMDCDPAEWTWDQLDEPYKSQHRATAQGDAQLVATARKNLPHFINAASFGCEVDRQAALKCVEVLNEEIDGLNDLAAVLRSAFAAASSLTPPADADAGLVEALEESRRWEAKLILDERPWVVDSGVHIPQDLWDEYISTVQTKREAALGQGGVR